ncbi:murein hydrolase activator EnvC family protein [Radiobacillus sp. PE A8.2]|uniref:murein hydrolase activator EnvC family protein n=1 Tax=Radiobacillus sp. PE A8.2 TaxID=3380349 RepID=UPI00388EF92F
MKNVFTYSGIIIILLATLLPSADRVAAEGVNEITNQIDELKEEKNNIESNYNSINDKKSDTDKQLQENLVQQQKVTEEIQKISNELADTQAKLQEKQQEIDETTAEITTTNDEITQLMTEIANLEERIAKREELLKNRLRNLQQTGGDISYFQVLMGSKSFGDFLNRVTAVTKIMDQDKSIIETNNQEKADLETKQNSLEVKQAELEETKLALENQQSELVTIKSSLDTQVANRQQLMSQLEEKEHQLEEYNVTLEMEQEVLANEKVALEKAIQQAQNKKKQEEERLAAEKAERERLAQLAAEKNQDNQSDESSVPTTPTTPSTPSTPPSSGGLFGWPAGATYVSSEYGNRWGDFHKGMDIAAGGTVPIYAAEDGVVSMARHYNRSSGWWSFGNFVMITHYINGQQYTTVYAHMRSLNVSYGQTVTRGQQIGVMGNTGNSTGQHLHFEIHKGGYGSSNTVNPRSYLY